ncbi:MAG TPA: hypothetical protein PKG90_15345 [Chitinophagaceae bacterium]|nr:hypothetical protein [Chitinophagaceae bacterium]
MNFFTLAFFLLFPFPFSCNQAINDPKASPLVDNPQTQKTGTAGAANVVFKSADGGESWQNISEGLPADLRHDYDIGRNGFIATDIGLWLTDGNGIYHCEPNSKAPFWTKEIGKTWKQIHTGGGIKQVESNGVLLSTSNSGIIRSTDGGKNWELVISDGGVGIDVACIKGGFAAINYSTAAGTRRIRTSYDSGKTWQAIDAGFPGPAFVNSPLRPINTGNAVPRNNDSTRHAKENATDTEEYKTSIIQVGEKFFCGHTDGVYMTSDKGKTWKLVLPAEKGKMFSLFVSGNVIYALQTENHC